MQGAIPCTCLPGIWLQPGSYKITPKWQPGKTGGARWQQSRTGGSALAAHSRRLVSSGTETFHFLVMVAAGKDRQARWRNG